MKTFRDRHRLSEGWAWTTIGEVVSEGVQQSAPTEGESFCYVDISSIDNKLKRIVERKELSNAKAPSRARQRLNAGDVLVSMTRPNLNAVAIVPDEYAQAIGSTGFCVLRAVEVHPSLLFYLVQSEPFVAAMNLLVQGALYPAVRPKDIFSFSFAVPPLNEQLRIVAKIEELFTKLDAGVEELKKVQKQIKRFRQAVLRDAVTGQLTKVWREENQGDLEPADLLLCRLLTGRKEDWEQEQQKRFSRAEQIPGNNDWKKKYKEPSGPRREHLPELPRNWNSVSLEQITSGVRTICYGILMPKENLSDGVLFVKVRDMRDDKINLSSLHRTSFEIAAKYARASLKTGDILLSIRGTYGRVAEVPVELDGGGITQDTARLDISSLVNPQYIALHLRSELSQNYFKRVARGVAVKGVNIFDVKLTPILLPALAEQQKIVEEVDRLLSVSDAIEITVKQSLKQSERLRQSILKQAFDGKLVSQDPTDESAEVLLERIKEEREARKKELKAKGRITGQRKAKFA